MYNIVGSIIIGFLFLPSTSSVVVTAAAATTTAWSVHLVGAEAR